VDLLEVSLLFCSQANLPRRFSVWQSSTLLPVFTTDAVRQNHWKDWTAKSLRLDHARLGGTSDCIRWVSIFGWIPFVFELTA
jgi:hypothetical protein